MISVQLHPTQLQGVIMYNKEQVNCEEFVVAKEEVLNETSVNRSICT